MIGAPEQGFDILFTQIALDFDMSPQLGYFETPLPGVERPITIQDVLLMSHPHFDAFEFDVLFAGHAHEGDNRSVGQTGLQKRKGVESFVLTVEFFRLIADKDMAGVERLGSANEIHFFQFGNDSHFWECSFLSD